MEPSQIGLCSQGGYRAALRRELLVRKREREPSWIHPWGQLKRLPRDGTLELSLIRRQEVADTQGTVRAKDTSREARQPDVGRGARKVGGEGAETTKGQPKPCMLREHNASLHAKRTQCSLVLCSANRRMFHKTVQAKHFTGSEIHLCVPYSSGPGLCYKRDPYLPVWVHKAPVVQPFKLAFHSRDYRVWKGTQLTYAWIGRT